MGKRLGAGLGKDKGQASSAGAADEDDPNKPPGIKLIHYNTPKYFSCKAGLFGFFSLLCVVLFPNTCASKGFQAFYCL